VVEGTLIYPAAMACRFVRGIWCYGSFQLLSARRRIMHRQANSVECLCPGSSPPGEAVVIELPTAELIEVVGLSVKGNQVKLGTDAPKHLPVVQKELL
jgi:hypothetical protein